MYPRCPKPKTHPIDKCWTREREKKEKESAKKHKAKKAKKKATVESDSDSESGSDSSDSDTGRTQKRRHRPNRSQVKTLRVLKVTIGRVRSYKGHATGDGLFVAYPDSGASNHMTHKLELFDSSSFETLKKPILAARFSTG